MFHKVFICLIPLLNLCASAPDVPAWKGPCDGTKAQVEVANPSGLAADKLDDRDILFLRSHNADYWRAADQETLRQVLFIHRHGDRTPIFFQYKDELAKEPFWKFHGLSQLTNRGKSRLFALGKIIRQRYDQFLGGSVNKNIRKSRSSGALRCIESAQLFLASFLALDTPKSPDARSLAWGSLGEDRMLSNVWQPASIVTWATKYDGMMYPGAKCESMTAEIAALDETEEFKAIMREFKHEAEVMSQELGFKFDHVNKWVFASSLIGIERSYFGDKLRPALKAIYDRLQEAGDRAMVLQQKGLRLKRARVGLLIDDIIKNMLEMSQSSTSPFNKKFVHYSAHDVNVVNLMGVLDNLEMVQQAPDYGANISIELHEDQNGWFVKFFYMAHVPSEPIELHMKACEQGQAKRCSLARFSELMEQYRVSSWWNWMQECGNSVEGMDPYVQNN